MTISTFMTVSFVCFCLQQAAHKLHNSAANRCQLLLIGEVGRRAIR
jgi:hypothetical protein